MNRVLIRVLNGGLIYMSRNNNDFEVIGDFLSEHGFDSFYLEESKILVVDYGGCDSSFLSLFSLINDNLEYWTYELMLNIKLVVNIPNETIIFDFE